LTEVILQYRAEHPMAEITWQALSFFLEKKFKLKLPELMEYMAKITSSYTLEEQSNAYMQSVSNGHGVITVAHSQGNFFTNEAFKDITTVLQKGWMKPYLHMISVAPPSKEVFNEGPHVLFDNDTIAVLQAQSVTHKNPYRSQFHNAINEVVDDFNVAFHSFAYYMGEEVTYSDGFGEHTVSTQIARKDIEKYILDALDAHMKADSQWEKKKDFGCMCKDKRITMKHKWDSNLSKELDNTKIIEFDKKGKLYFVLNQDLAGLTYVRSSANYGELLQEVDENNVCLVLKDHDALIMGEISGPQKKSRSPRRTLHCTTQLA